MVIIFHGLVEIGLCGDEFLLHRRELLTLYNKLCAVCIIVVRFSLGDSVNVSLRDGINVFLITIVNVIIFRG